MALVPAGRQDGRTRNLVARRVLFGCAPQWPRRTGWRISMNNIVYLVGLVVIVIAILSFFGLR
ncbi:MAG: hypothetical protein U1E06_13915 [Tabrizicola sp.]|uniref:hypothetical protein n=1 Tax=Tabrizicola sp. TaxID=2005166 RepID=UPI0027352875|nr:hypothetical protein [Tabrizicola sp.]MDP3264365.1 hypothetical protein [Tabrizicola sp.]MDP3648825.1 hypothetical protein [Paracoccaceae bacterium]MDZ4067920.1 hypothetical protein [Tabrizicola sp.]